MDSFKTETEAGPGSDQESIRGSVRGRILEIQRMSTEDGPGLRTTVFFKGCPLACDWCHNPESISSKPQLVWQGTGCIGCRICLDTCENKALTPGPEGLVINRERCRGCGRCADQCPSLSLTLLGQIWSATDLVCELAKDMAYFRSANVTSSDGISSEPTESYRGGVTLSGGEPTLQHQFVLQVLKKLQTRGIHTALDTCGLTQFGVLKTLLPHTDLLLFDVKEMDCHRHETFTGSPNTRILENLAALPTLLEKHHTDLWIRTPVIPGATDRKENIQAIGAFIAAHLGDRISRWELCAFNPLGKDKYTRLGRTWAYETALQMEKTRMDDLYRIAVESGVDKAIVVKSGAVRSRTPLKEEI